MHTPNLRVLDYETPGSAEKELLKFYEDHMVGQPRAKRHLVRELLMARAFGGGMRQKNQVAGRFFAFGPPGSGKTYIAKLTALLMFGDMRALTRIDCTEFQQEHTISRIIGASHSYIGYDDEPMLTQWALDEPAFLAQKNNPRLNEEKRFRDRIARIKRELINTGKWLQANASDSAWEEKRQQFALLDARYKRACDLHSALKERNEKDPELRDIKASYNPLDPYFSILLFDEPEKADEALLKLCIQMLGDEATLRLHSRVKKEHGGQVVQFCNTFVFFASNIGEKRIREMIEGGGIGFKPDKNVDQEGLRRITEKMRTQFFHVGWEELKKSGKFSTAFLSRVGEDNFQAFAPLTQPDMLDCLERIMMPQYTERLRRVFPVTLHIQPSVHELLVEEACDANKRILGMRALNDAFHARVERNLQLLAIKPPEEGGLAKGDEVVVDAKDQDGKKRIVIGVQDRAADSIAERLGAAQPESEDEFFDDDSLSEEGRIIAVPPLYGLHRK